jgi:hypothetical protein
MNGKDLVAFLRETRLNDISLPYAWSETELLRALNYAEAQACRRAHLLIDGLTTIDAGTSGTGGTAGAKPLCVLTLTAGQSMYYLSPKIIQVRRLQLDSMTYPLPGPVAYAELDSIYPGWQGTGGTCGTAGTGGVPSCWLNEPTNTITFILAPSASDTARLIVSRLPLMPFTLQTSPEIEERYHEGLLDWAAHLALMKPDSDTINLNLSELYEKKFIEQFGPLPDAYTEKIRKTVSQNQRMRARTFGS